MYTRHISNPPENIVKDGVALFGDYNFPPNRFGIQHLKQPFILMPFPNFITKKRIRTILNFSFSLDAFDGTIEIMDARFFCFAEVTIFEKDKKRKLSYRAILFRKKTIPVNIKSGISKCPKKSRYIQTKWNYEKKTFSILCRLKHDETRPDVNFLFSADLSDRTGTLVSVVPCPIQRRCAATHNSAFPIEGIITTDSAVLMSNPFEDKGLGFFTIRRSFYKFRFFCESIVCQGNVDGTNIQFSLYSSNQDAVDNDVYNENVLFVDGVASPLPPVKITRPNGLLKNWVIQDTESMIDLAFLASTTSDRKHSLFILRTNYRILLGSCEGSISDKDGTVYSLKNFSAVAKKQYLRL